MPIARELILSSLLTRLEAIPAANWVRRSPEAEPDMFPSLALDDGGQSVLERSFNAALYRMSARVEGAVALAGDAATQMNALYGAVLAAVATDPTFGGLAEDALEVEFNVDKVEFGDVRLIGFELVLAIEYWARPDGTSPAV